MELEKLLSKLGAKGGVVVGWGGGVVYSCPLHREHPGHTRPISLQRSGLTLVESGFKLFQGCRWGRRPYGLFVLAHRQICSVAPFKSNRNQSFITASKQSLINSFTLLSPAGPQAPLDFWLSAYHENSISMFTN